MMEGILSSTLLCRFGNLKMQVERRRGEVTRSSRRLSTKTLSFFHNSVSSTRLETLTANPRPKGEDLHVEDKTGRHHVSEPRSGASLRAGSASLTRAREQESPSGCRDSGRECWKSVRHYVSRVGPLNEGWHSFYTVRDESWA